MSKRKAACKVSTTGKSGPWQYAVLTDPDSSSFAVEKANSLRITGHAKNCDDGTVQGEAQGDASSIDKFLQHLNRGPGPAHVNKVDSKEISTRDGESGFDR
ncbi:hypothetical protein B0A54_12665 [Friedmanniomyces endolithicus]|uniref:Acylphosphatase-like domain-containing protein n=1 Tax=Friedmanniomyces endolithicus TaxID=329885 RepID=A0A4U0UJM8_9PEZI|nr:hypothetical protein B0A54_12665 [Friedmanniomyces endolithicus]